MPLWLGDSSPTSLRFISSLNLESLDALLRSRDQLCLPDFAALVP